MSKHMKWTK